MIKNVNFFIKTDYICDYIPIISSGSNLIALFQKYVVIPFLSNSSITQKPYYVHLQQKSFFRCVTLLVPVIGNIMIIIYDLSNRKYNNKNFMLAAVRQNAWKLASASEPLKDDKEVVLAAVQRNGWVLQLASERLKNDKEVVLAALRESVGGPIRYVGKQLKNDREVMLVAVQLNFLALEHASEKLKDNKEFVLAAVQNSFVSLNFASERLKKDRNFLLAALLQSEFVFQNFQGLVSASETSCLRTYSKMM